MLVRNDQSGEKSAEDGVYSDNVGHEGRDENEEEGDNHYPWRRTVFKRPGSANEPCVGAFYWNQDEQRPSDCTEEDVDCRDTGRGVNEGDGESEQDPADNVVAYACTQYDLSDPRFEEFGFRQDSAENGKGGNSCRHTDEENKDAEIDVVFIDEFPIDGDGDTCPGAKRQNHACSRDTDGALPVAFDDAEIDLETD